jgi:hypothetical protein
MFSCFVRLRGVLSAFCARSPTLLKILHLFSSRLRYFYSSQSSPSPTPITPRPSRPCSPRLCPTTLLLLRFCSALSLPLHIASGHLTSGEPTYPSYLSPALPLPGLRRSHLYRPILQGSRQSRSVRRSTFRTTSRRRKRRLLRLRTSGQRRARKAQK